MKNSVLPDEILVNIRQYGECQIQLTGKLLTIGGAIGANRNHFGAQIFDLLVSFLQLTELRAAVPSSLSPIKDHENRLLALEGIQAHGRTLNRKPSDVRSDALRLKREQQSEN